MKHLNNVPLHLQESYTGTLNSMARCLRPVTETAQQAGMRSLTVNVGSALYPFMYEGAAVLNMLVEDLAPRLGLKPQDITIYRDREHNMNVVTISTPAMVAAANARADATARNELAGLKLMLKKLLGTPEGAQAQLIFDLSEETGRALQERHFVLFPSPHLIVLKSDLKALGLKLISMEELESWRACPSNYGTMREKRLRLTLVNLRAV